MGQFNAEAVIQKNYISNLEKYVRRFDNADDENQRHTYDITKEQTITKTRQICENYNINPDNEIINKYQINNKI